MKISRAPQHTSQRGIHVLEAMHAATGDLAFTPVPLLAEYATAGTRFRS